MVNQTKVYEVENLLAKLKEAKSFFLADYQGLNASLLNKLRGKIKKEGGEFLVVKNSLIKRAITQAGINFQEDVFIGPTACLLDKEGDLQPLKSFYQGLADWGKPMFRAGALLGKSLQVLTGNEVTRLAKLPGEKELKSKLLGSLTGLLREFLYVLQSPTQKLVLILNEIESINGKSEEVND